MFSQLTAFEGIFDAGKSSDVPVKLESYLVQFRQKGFEFVSVRLVESA